MIKVYFRNNAIANFASQEFGQGKGHSWLPDILHEEQTEGSGAKIVTIAGCQSMLLYEYEKFETREGNNDLR